MGRRADEKGNSTSRGRPDWTASKLLGNDQLLGQVRGRWCGLDSGGCGKTFGTGGSEKARHGMRTVMVPRVRRS